MTRNASDSTAPARPATARAKPYDRDRALDAALELFWARGYHATSLKDLEAALNMRPGSIYAAFTSKEALFRAALERYFARTKAEMAASVDRQGGVLEGLAAYLPALAAKAAAGAPCRACMLVKTLLEATAEEDALSGDARRYLDAIGAEIAALMRRAVEAGELPQGVDPERLARRYQSNITALKIEAQRGLPARELAELAQDMATELLAQGRRPA